MKRRIDTGGRGEAASGIVSTGGIAQGGQGVGGPGGVSGGPGYIRGPSLAQLGVGVRPGQSNTPIAVPVTGAGAPVPVVPVPATTAGGPGVGVAPTLDHQTHNTSQTGYASGKIDMHTVHHSVPAYSANLATAPASQGGGLAGVVEGRAVGGTGGLGAPSGVGPPPSVLQHVTAHSQMRHKVSGMSSANVVHQNTAAVGAVAAAAAAGATQGSGQFQRLKVEDALSYLDQVKLRFGKQPQVYNDFLDIMKEFKSQSIDTPGVIARVSQLFRGHPELIVGFNTFLPPGYKIEVSVSVPGQQTTVVHTPQGVHHHITPTHHPPPPPPPAVTVKPPHHPPPPRSTLQSSCIAPHTGPNLVGTHGVHNISTSGTGGTGASSAAGGGSAGTNPGSGTTSVVSTGGSSQVPSNVSVGATTPTGTSASASANSNTSSVSGSQQHSTNTAPQHPSREPQPPPPHHHHHHQPPAQPVEFNHAINYVNKIKLRFQGQPDIYKQFLEILHTYQKEQRHLKEGGNTPTRTLTETEVYEKVAKLFENQEDLLQEFGQFLPDATNNSAAQAAVSDFMDQYRTHHGGNKSVTNDHTTIKKSNKSSVTIGSGNNLVSNTGSTPNKTSPMFGHQLKRPHSGPTQSHTHTHAHSQPPVKKPKLGYLKDMSAAEAGKYATLAEYAFFDQVRKALRHEEPYHNFLRVITMYNEEIITRSELVQLVHPFLAKFPDLLKWFKDFVGYREGAAGNSDIIPSTVAKQERISGDLAMEIDYTTCKRLGASYCALPKTYPQPKCSGRTSLCREVLNDTWVSFPSWSEDSTFVTSRKTQYEEYIYRCEDERFELDVVIETNLTTMRVLEGVHKKLQRMSPEEAARFRLDDSLGGNSPTIHQRAIRRIYGDKAPDILDGLKKNPVVAVPLVLRRLKAKDEEWREAQKGFNKIWREQNEKYYLKSLDHQGITFKQNDIKTIRSKSLLNDIETLFDERHEQAEESGEVLTGPHMVLHYPDKSILDDAANLVIHHVKRQTTYHKDDKAKIKHLVRHFVPDLLFHPRQEMSDDERDLEDEEDNRSEEKFETNRRDVKGRECKQAPVNPCPTTNNKRKTRRGNDVEKEIDIKKELPENFNNNNVGNKGRTLNGDATEEEKISIKTEDEKDIKLEPGIIGNGNLESDDEYRLFMCNNNWYLFLRLHQILCCRLTTMYEHAVRIAAEEAKDKKDRKEATAVALRLKPKNELAVEDYYPALLDMIKNVLDGNLEPTAYEDTLREMFGIHAFTGFTLDKVVTGAVRQLQHLVCDDPPLQCTTSYIMEAKRGAAGGPVASAHRRLNLEQSYQKKLERQLQDENCFKIYTYKKNCRMTIELIDTEIEEEENPGAGMGHSTTASNHPAIPPAVAEVERWSEYVEKYVSSVAPQMSPSMQAQLSRKPVFLPRNLRSWRKLTTARQTNQEMDKRSCTEDIKPPVCPEMEILDNTQCKFNLSSFKMVFVVNSDSYMYKKQALKRAKQSHEHVSKRMHMGLTSWHSDWCSKHVSEAGQNFATDWFLGHTEGLRPNKTRIVRVDNPSRPPFAPYNKYKCELDESGGGS